MRDHGGRRGRGGRGGAGPVSGASALAPTLFTAPPGGPPYRPAPPAEVGWGFTHTRYSADQGEDRAVRRARATLEGTGLPQVQHLMGWGADNPEPRPGAYDFAAMDRRIALAGKTGATPVVTLCCAPDWMKGGTAGRTDWSVGSLERAPDPEHYADFARLAATTARRYPQVRHYLVWNEFKGFWNETEGRWDHEGYTELYNQVRRALKEVDPAIRVGGPYLVMDSFPPGRADGASREVRGAWGALDRRTVDAFRYWNRHKDGADFVVVDGSSYTVDGELVPDAFAATAKFTDVGRWLRAETGGRLPLWWAEYYVEPGDADDRRADWPESRRRAAHAAGLVALAKGGATTAFYWNPERPAAPCPGCLWRPTHLPDGGTPLPMLDLFTRFQREFGPGTRFASVPGDTASGLSVLADDRAVLAVNHRATARTVRIDGARVRLEAYEVRWLGRTGR
ncbi:GH39 family glycosyl hydrolase [Streptomyces diastaticus]|uniref:GH39 family glycosyl hydrolase n=1 Tax=Streptomyces diastaticus TaxID=1956 RepID=UPI00366A2E9D